MDVEEVSRLEASSIDCFQLYTSSTLLLGLEPRQVVQLKLSM